MDSESKLYHLVMVLIVSILLTITVVSLDNNAKIRDLVKLGAAPMEASCAISGSSNSAICSQAMRK